MQSEIVIYCDADFAGCPHSRKSTSGGAITWGSQLVKTWAKTQPVLALSTGEAELAAVVKASAEALGMQSVLRDLGHEVELTVRSDATAAIGMVRREGLGRVRHLAVADLWVQQKSQEKAIKYSKIDGKQNPSDMLTKGLGAADIQRYLTMLGLVAQDGRAASAPSIDP